LVWFTCGELWRLPFPVSKTQDPGQGAETHLLGNLNRIHRAATMVQPHYGTSYSGGRRADLHGGEHTGAGSIRQRAGVTSRYRSVLLNILFILFLFPLVKYMGLNKKQLEILTFINSGF
jgi:hypothetical protein